MSIRMRHAPYHLLAVLAAGAVASAAHANPVYSNDFESNLTTGFTGVTTISAAPNGSTHYLGELGLGGTATLTLNTAGLTSITLNYDLYGINTLDGDGGAGGNSPSNPDAFIVNVGSTTISDYSFAIFSGDTQNFESQALPPTPNQAPETGAAAVNTLGFSNGDDTYHFSYTFAPTGPTTTISFVGSTNQDLGDEGFGLDNVDVTGVPAVTTGGVPEPVSWSLMIMGFGLAGATLRLRRFAIAA